MTFSSGEEGSRAAVGRGTVRGISAAVDSATGSVSVRAVIEQPPQLRAGELLSGRIVTRTIEHALIVPLAALVPEDDSFIVYVVDEEAIAHATRVQVGERTEKDAQILSGLEVGQVVVTEGAYGVVEGATVHANDSAGKGSPAPASP